MADAIVTFIANKLTRLLVEEAKLLAGVHDKVTSLRSDLKFMNIFLNNSHSQRKDDIVAEVVNQIRDIAHEAEDIIDTYIADKVLQRRRNLIGRVFVGGFDHTLMLHNVASKIDRIKIRINEILGNKKRFGIEGGSESRNRGNAGRIRKQRREVEEQEVVGFVHDSKIVIEKLVSNCSRLKVVSIIGMGGLGKTTLARKIYNNKRVKNMFPCRAWGYVSNHYRPREFFLSLLKCLLSTSKYNDLFKKRENTNAISDEELKMKVRECLSRSGKFLIVVDDVWENQVWNKVKDAFPDDCNGSRILITTRSAEVASYAGPMPPYNLPFLTKQKSWELLSKKVFRGEECPSDLESMGKLIAESCDGLPLAIIVMAGILAKKKSLRDWSKIKDHVNWRLGRVNTLKDILKLSYDTLPLRLKPCFLYLGMYPKDYKIPVKRLIQLWISEGFLAQETSRSPNIPEPEIIAEEYLDELVNHSLVQVVQRTSDGGPKTCQIHNVLHNLCISECKDEKFFEVLKKIDSQTNNFLRRLSLHGALFNSSASSVSNYSVSNYSVSATRSLVCFNHEVSSHSEVNSYQWKWLFKCFKLAHVLDLGGMNVNSLHADLKNLVYLKYLRINSKNLDTIPDSIYKLWNLETLDLRGSPIKALSGELWQLKQLRHLLVLGPVELPNMPSSQSETMPNLQTLSIVSLDPHTTTLFDNGAFPGLKNLALQYKKRGGAQLQSLQHLSNLRKIKVIGTIEIPKSGADVFPLSIVKITITKFGFFNSSAMKTLGKLPNLQVLKLSSQEGKSSFDLHCATGGFPQLQVFVMVGIKVKKWKLNKGSMPLVRRVVLRNCKLLNELPKQLWSLSTIREVKVSWPTAELAKTLQKLKVKNECKLVVYPRNQVKK